MYRRITQLIFILFFNCIAYSMGSYSVLNIPQDARSLALNNTTSAFGNSLIHNNPASISMRSKGMGYSYLYFPAKLHMSCVQHLQRKNHFIRSIKILLFNYGTILDSKNQNETFAYDGLFELSYKKEIKDFISIGISSGYLFSSISKFNSQLVYGKFGIRNRFFRKKLGIGFSIENFGSIIDSYTIFKEKIPKLFRSSFYYKLDYVPALINIDFINNFNQLYYSIGSELKIQNNILMRLGISNKNYIYYDNIVSTIFSNISFGTGVNFTKFDLDIGFMNLGSSGFIIGVTIINK